MKKRYSQLIPLLLIVFGAIFFVTFLGFIALSESGNSDSYNTDLTYTDITGNSIKLTDHKGKVIILYFFYLSCSFCKISDPFLAAIEDDYLSSQLLIITITIDTADSNINLYNWKSSLNASWIIVRDDIGHTQSSHWDVAYSPTTIIIDKDSNFVKKFIGSNNFDVNVRTEVDLLI
jgi:cytochrome oxidase Cu insertion factor (SCO1/SenC/PrrC family)